MTDSQSTEQLILEAARKVFSARGLQGARMQDIADEAGINKALLHYYFRSKDKLFEIVFKEAFSKFAMNVNDLMLSEASLHDKIDAFIDNYIQLLIENPYLPGFVIGEISNNPDRLVEFITSAGISIESFLKQVEEEVSSGNMRVIDGRHLFINIIALCVFPVLGRPIMTGLFFRNDHIAYEGFLRERKQEVKRVIFTSLRPDIQANVNN